MSFIGATGLDEVQEQFDILKDEIDANASYINTLVGIPDPTHLPFFGVNILNPGLYGLVERAEVNIKALQTQQGTTSTAISGIETSIAGIETSITGIEGQVTAVEGSISTIQFVELPLLSGAIGTAGGVAGDALVKANRSLDIWEESGNNVYHKKSGNVGIGITYDGLLTNKLEVNGNINIPLSSNYKINNQPLNYSHLAGTLSYNSLTDKLTQGTNITIVGNVINNTYTLPTAGVGTNGTLGGVKVDGTTIQINNQVISAVAGAQQVNSDWTQTNTSLKSYIVNKPTAGANISFANNQISLTDFVGIGTTPPSGNTKLDVNGNINSTGLRINNLAIGSDPTQNIINLSGNKLLINDKPDTERNAETFTTHTSLSEPSVSPNIIVADAYYPRVPATNSLTWTDYGKTIITKVSDAVLEPGFVYKLFNHTITSQDHYHSLPSYTATGNTYAGATRFKTFAGIAISVDFGRSIYPERMRIAPRPLQTGFTGNAFILGAPKAFKIFASDDASCWNDNNHSSWTQIHDQTTSLSYVNEQYTIVNFTANLPKYRYYTMVVLSTIGNYAGGYMIFSEWNVGGDEKIDAIPEYNSGSLTHKTLTFTYDPTKNAEYLAQQKTGVGGWRIVRFLPPNNLNRWYQGDYISTSTFNIPTIGTPYNYTNEWAVPFGTFDEMFFGTFNMTYWLQCLKTSVLGDYGDVARPVIKSSERNFAHSVKWFNRINGAPEDPWISINDHMTTPNLIVYGENYNTLHPSLLNAYGGMCVLVRDSTASALVPQPNTYNLSVSEGTSISINSGAFQYLSGNYTISVGSAQSSVVINGISQAGQTDPYPLQNGSTIAIRYYMLRRTITLDYYKKSGFIKYVPSLIGGEFPDTGSWQIVDMDNQALDEFGGSITFNKVMGNLPLDKLQDIDMSKITTGNLPFSRIDGNLPFSRIDGNLPATKLDSLDMSKITTGQLDYTRLNGQEALVNNRFLRIVEPYEAPTINTSGIWTSKYRVATNLHLNHYGAQYNYYRYYASISSNRNDGWGDRHKFWFGVVKFSHKTNIDGVDGFTNNTAAYNMYTNATGYCVINPTSSTDGWWWLNFTLTTAERTDQAIVILH